MLIKKDILNVHYQLKNKINIIKGVGLVDCSIEYNDIDSNMHSSEKVK